MSPAPTLAARRAALGPGLAVCLSGAALLFAAESVVPVFPAPMVAVAGGLWAGRAWPNQLAQGAEIAGNLLLKAGIILLGVRFSVTEVGGLGADALAVVLPALVIGVAAVLIFARLLSLGGRLPWLLAAGTAICGISAIVACAPLLDADEREVATSVSTVTIYGTVAMFVFPLVAAALGLSDRSFGLWAGSAINDTSQVVAASFSVSTSAGAVAVVAKLARNIFIVPLMLALSARRGRGGRMAEDFPWFVVGFVALAALTSLLSLPAGVDTATSSASRLCIYAALVGIGVRAASLQLDRSLIRPLMCGVGAGVVLAALGLWIVLLVT